MEGGPKSKSGFLAAMRMSVSLVLCPSMIPGVGLSVDLRPTDFAECAFIARVPLPSQTINEARNSTAVLEMSWQTLQP